MSDMLQLVAEPIISRTSDGLKCIENQHKSAGVNTLPDLFYSVPDIEDYLPLNHSARRDFCAEVAPGSSSI